jgi:hypothetical protein
VIAMIKKDYYENQDISNFPFNHSNPVNHGSFTDAKQSLLQDEVAGRFY